jgi:hypothetical protein
MAYNGVVTADRLVDPSYGLFSVAKVVNHGARDEHWIGGFFVETETCGRITDLLPLCNSTDDTPVSLLDGSADSMFFHVVSFVILAKYECENSIGFNAIDRRATVVKQLKAVTEFSVEHELWGGDVAQQDANPIPAERYLANATDVTPTPGTAVAPLLALGLVEQDFANNNPGVQATVHLTPLMAIALRNWIKEDGGKLYTKAGSLVTINRGHAGDTGPHTGGTATKNWIYATGPVHVDLGSDELITVSESEIVNSVTNKVTYAAERPAAVYFDGCSWFGALADATL